MPNKKMTFGLIIGNRGFFPDHLAKTGREEMLRALAKAGFDAVSLTPDQSKYGAVETREDDHRFPPRQLLRKDVGVQQPAPVRHSILPHAPPHRRPRLQRVRG